jgi:hypothetical protein
LIGGSGAETRGAVLGTGVLVQSRQIEKGRRLEAADFEKHLVELRSQYIRANPRQRILVALDRIKCPDSGPNRLIVTVSAVEGLARTIALHLRAGKGESIEAVYEELWRSVPTALIEKHVCPLLGKSPEELFTEAAWKLFKIAVGYRNLLIHECTFLRQDISAPLIDASMLVFNKLRNLPAYEEDPPGSAN